MRGYILPRAEERAVKQHSCCLCGEICDFSFRGGLLKRYDIAYYLCPACGLLQTEKPYWLPEAYSEALSAADTGAMQRNLWLLKTSSVLFRLLGMQAARFLDYGGGHGVLTRMMRDHGFDFHCWDEHGQNLFARGFEGDPDSSYDGVTAFEVLEHLADPQAFFAQVLGRMKPRLLFVSSELFCEPVRTDWHYFYSATGQHITFFQPRTLQYIAASYGYSCITVGSLHLFQREAKRIPVVKLVLRFATRLYPLLRFASLADADHQRCMREIE